MNSSPTQQNKKNEKKLNNDMRIYEFQLYSSRPRNIKMRNSNLATMYETVLGKVASTNAKLAYAYCCKLVLRNWKIWQDEDREPYKHLTTVMLRHRPTLDASAFSK